MEIKEVEIKNFRSVKDQVFTFDRNFQILVGINESGKTNLIKALSLLNTDVDFSKDDIRDPGHNEEPVEESYVNFKFNLKRNLINKIFNNSKEIFLAKNLNTPLLQIDNKPYTLYQFCRHKDEIFYTVNLMNSSRFITNFDLTTSRYKVLPNWKKITSQASYSIKYSNKSVDISSFYLVNINEYPDIPKDCIEDLDINTLSEIINPYIIQTANHNLPKCIVWNYSNDNLLPSKINLKQFKSDPSICIPLKNMFSLSGYHNASKSLEDAEQKTNGIRNILRKVSENTTQHMKNVWPEWKKQKVLLNQNGDFVDAGIEDEYNMYSLARRSDGFKRFFTFLLMISAQNKTEDIYNNLLIIDEPDIGLHPTGIQYLRKELNKIGNHNIVLVSTHSIFMIDKEVVDRHLIVEKNKEITEIKRVNSSNIKDEEVIYKALGYSLFDLLKPKNIIFEGWRDKRIFECLLKSRKGKDIINSEKRNDIGLLHAIGVKDIERIANLCENFSRDYVIITDSDKPAKDKKNKFTGIGNWFCYDDIDNIYAETTEDFLSNKLLNKAIKIVFERYNIDHIINIDDDITTKKINYIENKINKMDLQQIKTKDILNDIKEYICLNANSSDINNDYHYVAKFILSQISQ